MDIKDVKAKLHDTVYYNINNNIIPFELVACTLRMNKHGDYFYQAELLDLKSGNSVLIVPLDKVKTKNS